MILLDLLTESDIYDNYIHESCVYWKIEKTPEPHPKKLEINIDKPETALKKIDFNINVNNDETNDINSKEVVHPNDDLTEQYYSNIEDHGTQHEQTNRYNNV